MQALETVFDALSQVLGRLSFSALKQCSMVNKTWKTLVAQCLSQRRMRILLSKSEDRSLYLHTFDGSFSAGKKIGGTERQTKFVFSYELEPRQHSETIYFTVGRWNEGNYFTGNLTWWQVLSFQSVQPCLIPQLFPNGFPFWMRVLCELFFQ